MDILEIKDFEPDNILQKINELENDGYNVRNVCIKLEDEERNFMLNSNIEIISQCLEPYANSEIFMFLYPRVMNIMKGTEENLEILKCKSCKKHFLIHKFEKINFNNSIDKCRKCGTWEFKSIEDVPFDNFILDNIYGKLSTYLDKYISKDIPVPYELTREIKPYVGDLTITEINVVLSKLRKDIFKNRNIDLYNKLDTLEYVVNKVKENKEFNKFISDKDNLFSHVASQTKQDIMYVENLIDEHTESNMFNFLFPHPMKKTEDPLYTLEHMYIRHFSIIRDLYKSIFDLYEDHFILSTLGMLYKGFDYDNELIERKLYGAKIANKTKKFTENTPLWNLVDKSYISDIRNVIAHPNTYLNRKNKKIEIYKEGKLEKEYELNSFMDNLYELINTHKVIDFFRKDIYIYSDKEYLKTGGILSLQPDFENGIPVMIINQLEFFEEFIINDKWWKNNLDIKIHRDKNNIGIEFFIDNLEHKFRDYDIHMENEKVYALSEFIEDWIKIVLNRGNFLVKHRLCKPIIDYKEYIEERYHQNLISIPVYGINEEVIYINKRENIYGLYEIKESTKLEFEEILQLNKYISNKNIGRNDLCPCGSKKKFKKCHGIYN